MHAIAGFVLHSVNFFLLSSLSFQKGFESTLLRVEAFGWSRMGRAVQSMSGLSFLSRHKLL
jgi:hypothetical protein